MRIFVWCLCDEVPTNVLGVAAKIDGLDVVQPLGGVLESLGEGLLCQFQHQPVLASLWVRLKKKGQELGTRYSEPGTRKSGESQVYYKCIPHIP